MTDVLRTTRNLPSSTSLSMKRSDTAVEAVAVVDLPTPNNGVAGASTPSKDSETESARPATRGLRFWLVMVSVCVSVFLSALEYTSVATALPTIVHDLEGQDFIWVANAYVLCATAFLPTTGGMAEVFGRRISMLIVLALFALGSALCGAAQSINWLIAARAIQGAGGGGILATTAIIVADLVPLRERGTTIALLGLTWSVACALGPVVGGALANEGQWRWLFYLNLPVNSLAAVLVILFLRLKTPRGSFIEKIKRLDWIGNFLIIASSSACVLGLAWGGVQFPWSSAHVLAPLIIGIIGIFIFLLYDALVAREPLCPFSLFSNRTSLSGFLQTFFANIVIVALIYWLPLYYQACKLSSPLRAGVQFLGACLVIGPVIIMSGISVTMTKVYRPQLYLGWTFLVVSIASLSTVKADTSTATPIGISALVAIGAGFLQQAAYYPVLAPLPVSKNAHAMAFFSFCRVFAGVWGVAIGTAVLQTQLSSRLPPTFLEQFPQGVAIAYSVVPVIPTLPEPLRTEVRVAFADSISVIWDVMAGIAGMGLLASLAMKGLPLHTELDERWGLEGGNQERKDTVEMQPSSQPSA